MRRLIGRHPLAAACVLMLGHLPVLIVTYYVSAHFGFGGAISRRF